ENGSVAPPLSSVRRAHGTTGCYACHDLPLRLDVASSGCAANWAHRILGAKNSLTEADARQVEDGFRAKLATLDDVNCQPSPPTLQSHRNRRDPSLADNCGYKGHRLAVLPGQCVGSDQRNSKGDRPIRKAGSNRTRLPRWTLNDFLQGPRSPDPLCRWKWRS